MQYHILISRVNPALKIDLVRFCTIVDGQAKAFTTDEFTDFCRSNNFDGLLKLIVHSHISDSMYIEHDRIFALVKALLCVDSITIDYFDNNLVIIFDYDTETEEEKR